MKAQPLWLFFFLACILECSSHLFAPPYPCLFFAPFFVCAYQTLSGLRSLALAAIIGLLLDLLSADYPMGFFMGSYMVVTLLLYARQRDFTSYLMGLFCSTWIFSSLMTGVQWICLWLFYTAPPLTWRGIFTDGILLPLADALYALCLFFFPAVFYRSLKKKWFRFLFFLKRSTRKKRSPSGQPPLFH